MKYLTSLFLGPLLTGCIGASFISSNEGIYLDHSDNLHGRKDYPFPNYSSLDDQDPGNRVELISGLEIATNCHSEQWASFMPSIVVPLPPIIPLFPSHPVFSNELVFSIKSKSPISEVYLELRDIVYNGATAEPGKYRFSLNCADLKDKSAVLYIKHGGHTETTKLIYKKVHNFGWVWLSA